MVTDNEQIKRWRLILGHSSQDVLSGYSTGGDCQLSPDQQATDEALAAIYDESGRYATEKRSAGLKKSAPRLAKWLGDIRT